MNWVIQALTSDSVGLWLGLSNHKIEHAHGHSEPGIIRLQLTNKEQTYVLRQSFRVSPKILRNFNIPNLNLTVVFNNCRSKNIWHKVTVNQSQWSQNMEPLLTLSTLWNGQWSGDQMTTRAMIMIEERFHIPEPRKYRAMHKMMYET